jgi:hypothetical protein
MLAFLNSHCAPGREPLKPNQDKGFGVLAAGSHALCSFLRSGACRSLHSANAQFLIRYGHRSNFRTAGLHSDFDA